MDEVKETAEVETEATGNDVISRSDIETVINATAARTAQAVLRHLTLDPVATAPGASNGQGAEVRTLINCFDQVEDALRIVRSRTGVSKRQHKRRAPELQRLSVLRRTLLFRLAQLEVHPMQETEKVDFRLHEVAYTTPTHDPGKDGVIDEVIWTGFLRNHHQVARSQQVIVFKYTPPRVKTVEAANQNKEK
jgi:hypothetical protein